MNVAEEHSTRSGRLVNPATLSYEGLKHRLDPGDMLAITVDADKHVRAATREIGGVLVPSCGRLGEAAL